MIHLRPCLPHMCDRTPAGPRRMAGHVLGAAMMALMLLVPTAVPLAAQGPKGDAGGGSAQGQDNGARHDGQGNGKGAGQDQSGGGASNGGKPGNDRPGNDRPGNDGPGNDGSGNAGPAPDSADPDPDDGTPVISPDDPGVGDMVLDGPSEPAAAASPWESIESPSMSLAPPSAPQPASRSAPQFGPPASAASPEVQAPVPATATSPVVVELFTSQGCSSCPPADALLGELTGRPDVLALAWHVDYWDYLGWADAFARPEFTARQQAYGRRTGERAIYTPQIVVGGLDTPLDVGPASLEMLIDAHHAEGSPVHLGVAHEGGSIRIDLAPGAVLTGTSSVDLVRFVPRREVRIKGGENRGRTVAYRNVVVSVERLAVWDGRTPLRLTVVPRGGERQALPADTRHAVLVQQIAGRRSLGRIIAAVRFD